MTDFNIEEELNKLPEKPGVYLMHDANDEVIYVGKAKILRNRVRQYFTMRKKHSYKIELMVPRIAWFEYIVVDSEMEALVLECNLIKEYRPHYNTMLMDDKGYPYIRITLDEPFPRVTCVHQQKRDKARYFGPFPNVTSMKNILELMRKLYKIRSCNKGLPKPAGPDNRPCLYYHIGQCDAPCQGGVSSEDYRASVNELISFLNGNREPLKRELKEKMKEASEALEFEKAAQYRDLLADVEKLSQTQKATETSNTDRDFLAYAKNEDKCIVQVFFERGGKITGREHFYMEHVGENGAEILEDFIKQFYCASVFVPGEIVLGEAPEDTALLEEWLSARRGGTVKITIPKIGQKAKFLELTKNNAELNMQQDVERISREYARTAGAAEEIRSLLGLDTAKRMESYDISNISGFNSVGSMVVFEDGRPKKNDYRKFKIKSVIGPNDYESLREVLFRRFKHGMDEPDGGFAVFPDLILMDGGRGQVSSAEEVLGELGLSIPVCGMVKDDNHRTRGVYFRGKEIPINTKSEGFKLITRIQDETHRFAIEFHRSLRSKEQTRSILDDIPGIGEKRRLALIKAFKSLEELKNASAEEIAAVPSMDMKAALAVKEFFK
ncbi:MAG: excinuclease ABC subunit UvrC [Lachnospiraceae bacterium]|nr:excinuclease ABC subunit UvrC [Lachnospiraceae bacterium]